VNAAILVIGNIKSKWFDSYADSFKVCFTELNIVLPAVQLNDKPAFLIRGYAGAKDIDLEIIIPYEMVGQRLANQVGRKREQEFSFWHCSSHHNKGESQLYSEEEKSRAVPITQLALRTDTGRMGRNIRPCHLQPSEQKLNGRSFSGKKDFSDCELGIGATDSVNTNIPFFIHDFNVSAISRAMA